MNENGKIVAVSFYIYAAVMIFGRVMSIIMKRRKLNTVLNILAVIFWLLAAITVIILEDFGSFFAVIILGIMIPLQMLIRITQLSFARIRYDILINVIRRSMAPEILTGLLILNVCSSTVNQLHSAA